ISPDIELWSGALERLQQTGVATGLIHRGFSNYARSSYRNPPMWHLPLEMRRRHPEVMMLCDPSHICGSRGLLKSIAQTSIDLDFDGLMIETHITPETAWSDAAQQITPEGLEALLHELTWRTGNADSENNNPLT